MRNSLVVCILILSLCMPSLAVCAEPKLGSHLVPELGSELDTHTLLSVELTILPNGEGLPPGSGDVPRGEQLYRTHCMACHGVEGQGGNNDVLAGGGGTLTTQRPIKTIGSYWPSAVTVFSFIRRAMPYQTPGVLTNDEIYSLTAYLLFINGVVDERAVLDAAKLPDVVMPNANGFVRACCND